MASRATQAVALLMATSSVHAQGGDRALLSRRKTLASSGFEVWVTDYGATGDGDTDDTGAIQNAFKDLQDAGSGTVHFSQGNYVCSQLFLSGVNDAKILFEDGAQMTMYKSLSHWSMDDKNKKKPIYYPWFTVDSCNKLIVKGGTWNGDYDWWVEKVENHKQYNARPYMMRFMDVTDFSAHGITLNDAPHAHFKVGGKNSRGIDLKGLTFNSRVGSENTDGILLSSVSDAYVFGCHIQNGDDCLKVSGTIRNVTYEHSSCTGGHGLTIGGGSDSLDIDGATWRDIDLLGMSFGARLKWTKDTTGQVKNVLYDDIRMANVKYPLYITTGYQSSGERSDEFYVGDVTFKDITAWEDGSELDGSGGKIQNAGYFDCEDMAQCQNIHLRNVNVDTSKDWYCTDCGGDMANGVSPDASEYFSPAPPAMHIQSTVSGLCVDLPGDDTSNGAMLWTWDCYDGESQQFSFQDGQLVYLPDPAKCVDLLGGDTTNGNGLGLWDCLWDEEGNKVASQMWGLDPDMGTIYLASSAASDATKCAQIGGENRGDPLVIWDCTAEPQQVWTVGSQLSFTVV